MKKIMTVFAVTVAVCATLIWIARVGSDTALSIKKNGFVNVTGYAKKGIKADLGTFETVIMAKNADLKLAYDKLAFDREIVRQFIDGFHFPEADIRLEPVSVQERYKVNEKGDDTPELDHFVVSQSFKVRSPDVLRVQQIATEAGDLLGKGIELRVVSPEFLYTKLEELKIEMIGKAASNAKERAEVLSKNGRFRLGNVSDMRVGVFQITPLNSNDVSDYGMNDTTSIDKEIKSLVEVNYFVK